MDVILGILGGTALRVGGRLRADWGRPKEHAVLAALATQPGRSMSVETLTDWVWGDGDAPSNPTSALHNHTSRIRIPLNRELPQVELVSEHHAYRLVVEHSKVDYFVFGEAMAQARRLGAAGKHDQACDLARQALALWRGTPLLELDSERARNWRQRVLENEWIPANISLITSLVDIGDPTEALRLLNELDRDHGDNLLAAKQRLRALYAQWRVDEATSFFLGFRKRMRDNVDEDSAAEIQRFHERLTAGRDHVGQPRVRPYQLPDPVPDFTGRQDLVAQLDAALASPIRVAVLGGPGGVGKTALAYYWARRHRFPDGSMRVDLNGFGRGPRISETEIIDVFLGALGVAVEEVPTHARAGRLRELMTDRHRMLVLIDNAQASAEIQAVLPLLGAAFVLVTSRNRLVGLALSNGARLITVPPLTSEQSVALLVGRMGRPASDAAAAARLAGLCEGFPLAITLVGDHVGRRPGVPLDAFAERLRGQRLLRLGGYGDGETSLAKVFELSYLALSPETQRLFRLLGLHVGLDFSVGAAAALAGGDVEAELEELVHAHLLDQDGDLDRYRFHDLIRGYGAVLAGAGDFAAERDAAQSRLQNFYFHSANAADRAVFSFDAGVPPLEVEPGVTPLTFADADEARRWFETEQNNLVALVSSALASDQFTYWRTPQVVGPALLRIGKMDAARTVWELAIALSVHAGEFAEGASANNFADFLMHVGDFDGARPWLEKATRIAERLGLDNVIAATQHNLGRVEASRKQYVAAIPYFERALEAARRAGDVNVQAFAMYRLGVTFRSCGRYEVAAKFLHQSLNMREENGDIAGQGACMSEIGALIAERGDFVSAQGYCEQAVTLLEGIQDLAGAREARIRLVRLYLDRGGDRGEATAHALRAVELARQTWHAEDEARALDLLGQVRHRAGDLDTAEASWRAALRIYVDRGDLQAQAVQARLDELPSATSVPERRSEAPRTVRRNA
ncbi:tetratricopeptide repeat protein [Kutzneria sp. NPDC051319]|uniref:AfsR/SARP family transcriptional regulator n=1 Tax=Kutzneria sp. NPDC051319 TaxID=3155047 RepID=UPI003427FC7F